MGSVWDVEVETDERRDGRGRGKEGGPGIKEIDARAVCEAQKARHWCY